MPFRSRAFTWRKLALSFLVLVGALVASEAGLRLWLGMHGRRYSTWATREEIQRAADTTSAFVPAGPVDPARPADQEGAVLHPYTGVESWHDTGGVLQFFRERARPDDFKVLVMGGSVAASFAGTLQPNLPKLLKDAPGVGSRRVVVLDYAHAAYKQPQQVGRLVYLLSLGYRPDAVIEIDGFNEVALAFDNGVSGINPVYPSPPVWGALAFQFGNDYGGSAETVAKMQSIRAMVRSIARDAMRWRLYESSWLGRFTLSRMASLNGEFLELQKELFANAGTPTPRMRRQLYGPDYDHAPDAMIQSCVRCWAEGSMAMQEMCAARGIRYVQILQPTLHDAGAKPMSAAEKALALPFASWLTGVHLGYPLLRARVPELRASGVRLLDHSRVFADVEEPLYMDACHLQRRGEALWYERTSAELREALTGAD